MSTSDSGIGFNSPYSSASSSHHERRLPPFLATRPLPARVPSLYVSPAVQGTPPLRGRPRPRSAPSNLPLQRLKSNILAVTQTLEGVSAGDDDNAAGEGNWMAPDPVFRVQRAISVGSKQYGFTSVGRGFNWLAKEEEERNRTRQCERSRSKQLTHDVADRDVSPLSNPALGESLLESELQRLPNGAVIPAFLAPSTSPTSPSTRPVALPTVPREKESSTPFVSPLSSSPPPMSRPMTPPSPSTSRRSMPRSPTAPRPPTRRRSSQKRVSLVAGRLFVIEDPPPLPEDEVSPQLARLDSQSSLLSVAASVGPPSPTVEPEHYLGVHRISDYVIEGEAGRGAYGLVKRAREKLPNGKRGVRSKPYLNFRGQQGLVLASFDHQTGHQISYSCRLLEKTSQARDHSHRDLCHVLHFKHILRPPSTETLGSCSPIRSSCNTCIVRLDRRDCLQGSPQYLPSLRLFRGRPFLLSCVTLHRLTAFCRR